MTDATIKERPVIMSAPMVRAILDGRKTQTRRVVKPSRYMLRYTEERHGGFSSPQEANEAAGKSATALLSMRDYSRCPFGQPGDRLWVREAWGLADASGRLVDSCLNYRAEGARRPVLLKGGPVMGWTINGYDIPPLQFTRIRSGWRSPIHMPRWASRITLETTGVRVERLKAIGELDCEKEIGVEPYSLGNAAYSTFAKLWNSINEKRGFPFESDPWVWVIEFKRVTE